MSTSIPAFGLPILPIHDGTYMMIPATGEGVWIRQVSLRIVPAAALGVAALAASRGAHPLTVAALVLVPMCLAISIWPLSGGPQIQLFESPGEPVYPVKSPCQDRFVC